VPRFNVDDSGTVAVCAEEAARYTRFLISVQALGMPPGSQIRWLLSSDTTASRNSSCRDLYGEWVWFVDDDHAFQPDILRRLLTHDVDIIAPLVLRRHQPFLPVACLDDEVLDLSQHPEEGLLEVDHTGSSGMLIRRHVIEAMEDPWFELGNGISEDVNFCRAARDAGFSIHIDLGCRMGHITPAVVWPYWDENLGQWVTGFSIADGFEIGVDLTPQLT
jgi:hypothetical protein